MADQRNPKPKPFHPTDPTTKIGTSTGAGQKPHFPNPPESAVPDAATLKEQWRFAIRQYSKWYSHAWGTAILAGASFFALGWFIKGSNPLPSRKQPDGRQPSPSPSSSSSAKDGTS